MVKKPKYYYLVLIFIIAVTVGCTTDEGQEPDVFKEEQENLTIRFATQIDHEQFTEMIMNPLAEQYPHIDFSLEGSRDLVGNIETWKASENGPDILIDSKMLLGVYENNNFIYDLDALIKRHDYSLDHIYKNFIPEGAADEIWGLPLSAVNLALIYNKDIFDAFQVPYPKNNITWEEIAELSQKVTGQLDERQIYGLSSRIDFLAMASQLGVEQVVDPVNETVNVNNEPWHRIGQVLQMLYKENPENIYLDPSSGMLFDQMPFFNGYAAMATLDPLSMAQLTPNFDWDMATYPTFPEFPNISPNNLSYMMLLNPNSEQKEAAFEIMTYLLTEELQTSLSRSGWISVLSKGEIHEQYGKNLDLFTDKNVSELFKHEPGTRFVTEEFVSESEAEFVQTLLIFLNYMQQIAIGQTDIENGLTLIEKELESFLKSE